MNNKEHLDLRQRLNRLDPWMVFKAITGRECPRSGDEGQCPYNEEDAEGPQWRIDNKRRTIKCSEEGKGGNIMQFVMDLCGKNETDSERHLVGCWNDMLKKELADARKKNKHADDNWSSKEIDLSTYDSLPDDQEAPYYRRDIMLRRQLMAEVMHEMQREFWRNDDAREFANSRGWSDRMARDWDFGFCDWHTVDNACETFGWSRTELYECGLLSKGEKGDYDTLHGRIVFPVYDRFGSLTGYTSRITKAEEDRLKAVGATAPKYKAAPGSTDEHLGGWLEDKSRMLYGLHRAYNSIVNNGGKIYMPEGNPDVIRLHSIGVDNAAAPMGTGYNEQTWHALEKARVSQICFVPDLDPAKDGQLWGVGINTVMTNGKEAIKAGFQVSVRELPWPAMVEETYVGDDDKPHKRTVANPLNRKVDADDWFNPTKQYTSWARWDDIREESFILWYAKKSVRTLSDNPTPEERNRWALDIAEMLICLDESLRDDYIADLIRLNKAVNKSKWNEACKMHIGKKKQEEMRTKQRSTGNLRDYGIQEANGCYYLEGEERPFTNFIVEPHYFIERWGDSHWICRAISNNDRIRVVDFDNDTITSGQKMKSRMASLAMRIKIGKSQEEIDSLFAYISENSQEVKKIDQIGWQPSLGVFAWGNGVTVPGDKKFHVSNEYGVSDYGSEVGVYIPSSSKVSGMDDDNDSSGYEWERSLRYEEKQAWTIKEVFQQICRVYGPNGSVAIMFLVATLFRDVINKYSQGFPILCGFGPRGSGKSSIGQTLTSFFSPSKAMKVTLGDSTTDSSLDLLLGHAQNVVVQLDEYKNTIKDSQIAIIKAIWDSEGRSVRNMASKNKSSIKTKVRCGVVVTGQEIPNVEAAMFSRFLPCEFYDDKAKQMAGKADFDKLKAWESKGFSYLTKQILDWRKEVEDGFQDAWDDTVSEVDNLLGKNNQVMVRIKNNWCAILSIMNCLQVHDIWPFNYLEARALVVKKILEQSKMNEQSDERADFWKTFYLCVGQMRIRKGAHYKIKPSHKLVEPSDSTKMQAEKKAKCIKMIASAKKRCERVLLVRYDEIFPIIKAFARSTGEDSKLMDAGSMRTYINKEAEGYLGETPLETFADVDMNGRAVYGQRNGVASILQNRKSGVLVFDYDLISERYEIDLDSVPSILSNDIDNLQLTNNEE